jgi:SAM-dependent methyltransferase
VVATPPAPVHGPPRRGPIRPASHRSTNAAVFGLVTGDLTTPLRILDLGCGAGHFVDRLARLYDERGWDRGKCLAGADLAADRFRAEGVPFTALDIARPLPFEDGAFDLIVSIELFEHSPSPYALLAEAARVLTPGGRLIFSVPNAMNAISRLSFLLTGFYYLYLPPSARPENAGRLCGHIMPLPAAYWRYGLRRAGFGAIRTATDRSRRRAMLLAAPLLPVLLLGRAAYLRHVKRYDAGVYEENADAIREANAWATLTSRSLIFDAGKPAA